MDLKVWEGLQNRRKTVTEMLDDLDSQAEPYRQELERLNREIGRLYEQEMRRVTQTVKADDNG